MADDDQIIEKANRAADALEAKASSVAHDLQDVAIETAKGLQKTMRLLAEQMIHLAGEMRGLSSYGKRNRRLIRLLAVSLLFDVLLSLFCLGLFVRSNVLGDRTDAIVASRTESRAATCASDNTFITNHNKLVDAVERAAKIVSAPNETRTPEQQAAAEKFVADYDATVETSRVTLRDCSPAAIEAFYKTKKPSTSTQPGG